MKKLLLPLFIAFLIISPITIYAVDNDVTPTQSDIDSSRHAENGMVSVPISEQQRNADQAADDAQAEEALSAPDDANIDSGSSAADDQPQKVHESF
jgi:hypothetical protein